MTAFVEFCIAAVVNPLCGWVMVGLYWVRGFGECEVVVLGL